MRLRTFFAFRTFANGSCSRWACWRCTGWAATSRLPASTPDRWDEISSAQFERTIFGFFDLFAGGNIRRLTVFALGIMPYITASIILQLLTVVVPTLEKLRRKANWAGARSRSGPAI